MKHLTWNRFFPAFLSRENTDLMLPFDEVSDAIDKLRNEINFYFEKQGKKAAPCILGVTSTEYNEGAFQTAIELAKSYARMSLRVLLLDVDYHEALATRFLTSKKYDGVFEQDPNIANVFHGTEGFSFCACKVQKKDVTAKLEELHRDGYIQKRAIPFDIVICSLPPVLEYADTGLISRDLDGVVYTVREYYTRQESILSALNYSEMIRNKIIGIMYYKTK